LEIELQKDLEKILESAAGSIVAVPLTTALAGVLLDYRVVYISSDAHGSDNNLSGEPLWLIRAHVSITGDSHEVRCVIAPGCIR
jgi:hypothetical protein